jgi:hypothetical protein
MKKPNIVVMTTLAMFSVFILASCEKNPNNELDMGSHGVAEKATVEVMLVRAPAHYEAINVDIQEVYLHSDVQGWVKLPLEKPGVYNLLSFTNGQDIRLGTSEFAEGFISQLRLVLGSNNSIVVDGVTYPLTVPSGSASGIRVDVQDRIEAGKLNRLWIDLETAQSVVSTGNGKFIFKPVVRLFSEASNGSISGSVFPAQAMPVVGVYNDTDMMMAIPDAEGHFLIRGIRPGDYTVIFKARASGYTDVVLKNVTVSKSKTTELDAVYLGSPFAVSDDSADKP